MTKKLWEKMCEFIAHRVGISVDRVKSILEDNGMHAYGHGGLVEMLEIVEHRR